MTLEKSPPDDDRHAEDGRPSDDGRLSDSLEQGLFQLGPHLTLVPVVHGSGDFAIAIRRVMLEHPFDGLAVPLPESFREEVLAGIEQFPQISIVLQREPWSPPAGTGEWSPEQERAEDRSEEEDNSEEGSEDESSAAGESDGLARASYVPIDPCQPVIAALRTALQERLECHFIDLETAAYRAYSSYAPDPYALKRVSIERFAAAVLPALRRPLEPLHKRRIWTMAARLLRLTRAGKKILALCAMWEWPWIREALQILREEQDGRKSNSPAHPSPADAGPPDPSLPRATSRGSQTDAGHSVPLASIPPAIPRLHPDDLIDDEVEPAARFPVRTSTLLFALGELPFITALYERARNELEDDENLSVDGVKELLMATRERYRRDLKKRARPITPQLLTLYLKYVRNLALIERRLTPDLYTLAMAAQQMAGDQFAINLLETARDYPQLDAPPQSQLKMGIGQVQLPDGDLLQVENRLGGPPVAFRSLSLQKRPGRIDQSRWAHRWNPFGQCSWPPEDVAIESFRTYVKDVALQILGTDLARSEKFTTSLRDGLDIRETLRNWHSGELYVKIMPPAKGRLDCVVMLFDSPADPRDYPWRTTWIAEHHDESTLALFATDFQKEMVGPGIGLATYGGALFLFPPRPVYDIWTDPRLDFCTTLEERLLAGGCLYSQQRHIAVLSEQPPGQAFRRIARSLGKKLVHVPLGKFSQATIQQLRMVHVLNGKQVRSFAAEFIRKA